MLIHLFMLGHCAITNVAVETLDYKNVLVNTEMNLNKCCQSIVFNAYTYV